MKIMHAVSATLAFFLFIALTSFLKAANLPDGFAEVLVAQGLDPTAMAIAPNGKLFLLEKNGTVRIVENGQLLLDPFMVLEVDNFNERGLSGIAIDPGFEQNGYLYLYYTVPGANHNRISRFTAIGNYVQSGSEVVLLDLDPMAGTIHNAGSMAFGADGKLYVSVGDGANANSAQSFNSLLGKVLRLEPDGSIPPDNPFYNQTTGKYRAIWALGFRNSFSLTIQPGTGRIFASEVGASAWEEVNEIIAGRNYGWPLVEGPLAGQSPPNNYSEPVFAYDHSQGCAAIGAAFYNPSNLMFPAIYEGQFFFADYCGGYIKYFNPDAPGTPATFATGINRPLNIVTAPDGTMYYLARAGIGGGSMVDNTASTDGTLWRVFYNGNGAPFASVNPQPVLIPEGESASFYTAASGVEPLVYQWQRDGVHIPGANGQEYVFPDAMLSDSGTIFRCIISNAEGADTTLGALLAVTTSQRPEPVILQPLPDAMYRGGDELPFQGMASDPEDGTLPTGALRWKIDFHHDNHTHPGLTPVTGIGSGTFNIPQTGETSDNVWYRVYLTATDNSGLSKTVSRDVFPVKTQFHLVTDPPGLPAYVDGNFQYTPTTTVSVVGILREIEALPSAQQGDSILLFKQWQDGEISNYRIFEAPDDTVTLTAVYEKYPLGNGTGLRGYYYDGPVNDPTFYEPYEFTRIDTTVNFDWGGGSPAVALLGDDHWLVRWEGFVEPLFDDDYNFHVVADDGVRLWVNNQLIIDQWVPQPPTEATGTINLSGGNQYPVKLEFFEEAGGAVCQLLWSGDRIGKSIIPKSQLYPEIVNAVVELANIPVAVYPNPARDILIVESTAAFPRQVKLEVINTLGQIVLKQQENLGTGASKIRLNTGNLPPGTYWVKINFTGMGTGAVKFVKH